VRVVQKKTIFAVELLKNDFMNYDLITILGPTASGKTSLAAALAARLKTEIISGVYGVRRYREERRCGQFL
jgi:tRNA dimethylallyltransferase